MIDELSVCRVFQHEGQQAARNDVAFAQHGERLPVVRKVPTQEAVDVLEALCAVSAAVSSKHEWRCELDCFEHGRCSRPERAIVNTRDPDSTL